MRWKRRAEKVSEELKEEARDEKRLREDVAIRQHELERRLRLAIAQGKVLGKGGA